YLAQNADTSTVIAPFKKFIGNARIRFHLATIDPQGRPTKGIVRHFSYLSTSASDYAKFEPWPNNKYINIWFIRQFGAAASGAAAYAIYPRSAVFTPFYDGVICLYNYADYEKTIPHELGHVLNLSHTWGSTNSPAVACGDDSVLDTPPTMGHNPVTCVPSALYDVTCVGSNIVHFRDIRGADSAVDYPDTVNAQNIMDYTYCSRMFTIGQCNRMRNALTSSVAGRNNLYTTGNLAATGALAPFPDLPPVADFSMERATGGGLVTDPRTTFLAFNNTASFSFKNRSWNDTITGVDWAFSNGAATPTSTSTNVVANRFSVPGWVTVTLVARANSGNDTLVNTHAVYAADTTPVNPYGYLQDFNGSASTADWPMMNYYNNRFQWQMYSGAGYNDSRCIRYRSYDTTNKLTGVQDGDYDDIFTPAFNLAGISSDFYFNFYSSGARISGSGTYDSLQLDVSTNGGSYWTTIGGYSGTNLSNVGTRSSEFRPTTASDWVARAIKVPAAYRSRQTYFRLRYRPGTKGNNLYIDNVYMNQFPVGVAAYTVADATFSVYPNPTSNGCTVSLNSANGGNYTVTISDLAGRTIHQQQIVAQPGLGVNSNIAKENFPSAGVYFVTVSSDGISKTEKLVVY
ncbi:MAG: T9SS C-terminal target domain-containing protein, partial [Chitinophagia bacterium]|nr:T9SS C-terminal target domain-containing protein [Chitinophagia bacterium]